MKYKKTRINPNFLLTPFLISLFISTFAPVKRKSVALLLLSVLVFFGACTPLSLLNKGKKAVKESQSYLNRNDMKTIASQAVAKVAQALEGDEVPADSAVKVPATAVEVPASAVEVPADSVTADITAIATSADSVIASADNLAGVAPAAAKTKRDTTTMDSLELAIYK